MLENNPREVLDDESGAACRRRLGRSEALRMVGLALSISDILLKRAVEEDGQAIYLRAPKAVEVSLMLR